MRDVGGLGLVFEVLADRHGEEAVAPGFLDADVGPDAAVGEHAVRVQVDRQDRAAIGRLWKRDSPLARDRSAVVGRRGVGDTSGRNRDDQDKLAHNVLRCGYL
jgi:hypothetical protein